MSATQIELPRDVGSEPIFRILATISFCHLLNDMLSALLPSIYPLLASNFNLNYTQVGLITLTYQTTASLLQPMVGLRTDRKPIPYSLPIGMALTLIGLLLLSVAGTFIAIIIASAVVGTGSSVFHPESSRVARMASGGQHGLAQSLFQVGGNAGLALGPLLVPKKQIGLAWFSVAAFVGMVMLTNVSGWAKHHHSVKKKFTPAGAGHPVSLTPRKIGWSIAILMALLFSKFVYLASLTSYYTFFLMGKFHLSMRSAQLHLSVFLGAVALGTIAGGPIGDRIGRKRVIWCSILGVLPFTLALPYANLLWTEILSVVIGLILASAFSVIVVYAQELLPGRVGMVSGLCFGFAFGAAGVGAAALGKLADMTSVNFVYSVCSFLPALGLLTAFLPDLEGSKLRRATAEILPE